MSKRNRELKLLRRYSKAHDLNYKACKKVYGRATSDKKEEYANEMRLYISSRPQTVSN